MAKFNSVQRRIVQMDSEIVEKMCQIDELESEIGEIIRRRERFVKRNKKAFTPEQLKVVLQEWPKIER